MIKIYNILLYVLCIFFTGLILVNYIKNLRYRESFLNISQDKSYMDLINGLSVNDNDGDDTNFINRTGINFSIFNVPNQINIPPPFSNFNNFILGIPIRAIKEARQRVENEIIRARQKGIKLTQINRPNTLCFQFTPWQGGTWGGCKGVLQGESIFYTPERITDCFKEQYFCEEQENDNEDDVPPPGESDGGNTEEQEENAANLAQRSEAEYEKRGEGVPGLL